jgi:hypothetical protein
MPIIDLVPSTDPLSQGDLLSGLPLFVTNESEQSAKTKHAFCLVLSRPCAAIRRPNVIVAAVDQYPDDVPRDLDSFDKVLRFLTTTRDGVLTPDLFYLGQIPNHKGRFGARFDSIHTVRVPPEDVSRSQFVEQHRIGRLEIAFARDLHLRILRAFASLGFDDQDWLSDLDLTWLVQQAKTDIAKLSAELNAAETESAKKRSAGKDAPEKRIEELKRKLDSLVEATQPYIRQFDARQQTAGSDEKKDDDGP